MLYIFGLIVILIVVALFFGVNKIIAIKDGGFYFEDYRERYGYTPARIEKLITLQKALPSIGEFVYIEGEKFCISHVWGNIFYLVDKTTQNEIVYCCRIVDGGNLYHIKWVKISTVGWIYSLTPINIFRLFLIVGVCGVILLVNIICYSLLNN